MNMRTALSLLLTTSAVLTAFVASPVAADKRAADAAVLQALDEQWSATAARKDLDGAVAFYADDAVLLPPNAPIDRDRKSIRESWAALLDQRTIVSWRASKAEVAKSGELG